MIKQYEYPYIPIFVFGIALTILGIFAFHAQRNIELVFITIIIPMAVYLGIHTYAIIKGKDKDSTK